MSESPERLVKAQISGPYPRCGSHFWQVSRWCGGCWSRDCSTAGLKGKVETTWEKMFTSEIHWLCNKKKVFFLLILKWALLKCKLFSQKSVTLNAYKLYLKAVLGWWICPKITSNIMEMVAQLCKHTKNQWIVCAL